MFVVAMNFELRDFHWLVLFIFETLFDLDSFLILSGDFDKFKCFLLSVKNIFILQTKQYLLLLTRHQFSILKVKKMKESSTLETNTEASTSRNETVTPNKRSVENEKTTLLQ